MVDISKFVESKNYVKAGPEINNKTVIIETEPFWNDNEKFDKKELLANVRMDGANHILRINQTSAKNLSMAWGKETSNWLNKKIRFEVVKMMINNVMRDVIFCHPDLSEISQQAVPQERKPIGTLDQQEVPHIKVASVEVNEKLFEIVNVKGTPMFAYIDDKKNIAYTQKVIDNETKIEYVPQTGEEIRKKAILLPTAATIEPLLGDDGLQKTIEEIHSFIKQYCDLPDDYIQIATYYVLLSYFYQRVDQIPYLSFLGDTGTGKSRCKQVIGSLCYLPILASGGARPAAIYRIIDKWGGTLLMVE